MGNKDWKTEYWSNQVRVAKGQGSTPDAADYKALREQLQEKTYAKEEKTKCHGKYNLESVKTN